MTTKTEELPNHQVDFSLLVQLAASNREFFATASSKHAEFLVGVCEEIMRFTIAIEKSVAEISAHFNEFDFDRAVPANGYRSLVFVIGRCVETLTKILSKIKQRRTRLIFAGFDAICARLKTRVDVLSTLEHCARIAMKLIRFSHKSEPIMLQHVLWDNEANAELDEIMEEVEGLDQTPFYSDFAAFWLCASLRLPMRLFHASMAGYSKAHTKTSALGKLAYVAVYTAKYASRPDHRAARMVRTTRHRDIDFFKTFWNLSETTALHTMSTLRSPRLSVNVVRRFEIDQNLTLPADGGPINFPMPSSAHVQMRILSRTFRNGMEAVIKSSPARLRKAKPLTSGLIFHCHGGAFVAQTSRSHEIYLRQWAKEIDATIVSVDYSLAPEQPYPCALLEVLYAYAWVLQNASKIGWTGERICFAGDSAGANIAVSTCLRLIQLGVSRLPDGVVPIYPVLAVKYLASPSRIFHVVDPLLPGGLVVRCLAAYTGSEAFNEADKGTLWKRTSSVREKRFRHGLCLQRRENARDPLMSPLDAGDELLRPFPRCCLIACHMDPFLDDAVDFARRLKSVGRMPSLDVLAGLPHAFLTFIDASPECRRGFDICVKRITEVINGERNENAT